MLALICGIVALSAGQAQKPFDLVLRGGVVVDGSGTPRFRADVAIKGDRIARINRAGIAADQATVAIDVSGLVVAPGFIDSHAHITNIYQYPLAENFLRQGITTILASLHHLGRSLSRVCWRAMSASKKC